MVKSGLSRVAIPLVGLALAGGVLFGSKYFKSEDVLEYLPTFGNGNRVNLILPSDVESDPSKVKMYHHVFKIRPEELLLDRHGEYCEVSGCTHEAEIYLPRVNKRNFCYKHALKTLHKDEDTLNDRFNYEKQRGKDLVSNNAGFDLLSSHINTWDDKLTIDAMLKTLEEDEFFKNLHASNISSTTQTQ